VFAVLGGRKVKHIRNWNARSNALIVVSVFFSACSGPQVFLQSTPIASVENLEAKRVEIPKGLRADLSEDGYLDHEDSYLFEAEWSEGRLSADINRDGAVDYADQETFYIIYEGYQVQSNGPRVYVGEGIFFDQNGDRFLDGMDRSIFLSNWSEKLPSADTNRDGRVNVTDSIEFLYAYEGYQNRSLGVRAYVGADFPADLNTDGFIDTQDLAVFWRSFDQGSAGVDLNLDGGIDGEDRDAFFKLYETYM
jgi:hypothetical protein